jgi:hypothetical protein
VSIGIIGMYAVLTAAPALAAGTGMNGYSASDYVVGMPNNGSYGPIGITFDKSGVLFLQDRVDNNLYSVPPGGGSTTVVATTNLSALTEGLDGTLFADDINGGIWKVDKSTGAKALIIDLGTTTYGIATDPLGGDLFVNEPSVASSK